MLYVRSALFLIWFIFITLLVYIGSLPSLLMPWRASVACGRAWAWLMLLGLKIFCGLRYEVRGPKPRGAVLVASKHFSMWETVAAMLLLDQPAIVMKRELLRIPLYGWYTQAMEMIPVDREQGARAIRALRDAGLHARDQNRAILIFPEGTRKELDAAPDYKPGAAMLYTQLGMPCVPMAHNSGVFFGSFLKLPGIIVVEFLPTIPPGLPRREFAETLEKAVEIATSKLVAEGRATL